MQALDGMDLRILDLLANNARMSYTAIGQAVGLSGPAVYGRVRKLEQSGIIQGYRAVFKPSSIGTGVLAFVDVDLAPQALEGDVVAALKPQSEVLEVYGMLGTASLLLKVAFSDGAALDAWLKGLRAIPGVTATHARIAIRTVFERGPAVPDGEVNLRRTQAGDDR